MLAVGSSISMMVGSVRSARNLELPLLSARQRARCLTTALGQDRKLRIDPLDTLSRQSTNTPRGRAQ
jgi:hypothetical protein